MTWKWMLELDCMKFLAIARGMTNGHGDGFANDEDRIRAVAYIVDNAPRFKEFLPHEPESTFRFILRDPRASSELKQFVSRYISIE